MEIQDPDALGRLAVKVGLLTEGQLAEAQGGDRGQELPT